MVRAAADPQPGAIDWQAVEGVDQPAAERLAGRQLEDLDPAAGSDPHGVAAVEGLGIGERHRYGGQKVEGAADQTVFGAGAESQERPQEEAVGTCRRQAGPRHAAWMDEAGGPQALSQAHLEQASIALRHPIHEALAVEGGDAELLSRGAGQRRRAARPGAHPAIRRPPAVVRRLLPLRGPAGDHQRHAGGGLAVSVEEPRRQLRAPRQHQVGELEVVEQRAQVAARRQVLGMADDDLPEPRGGSRQAQLAVTVGAGAGHDLALEFPGELQLGEPVHRVEHLQLYPRLRQSVAPAVEHPAGHLQRLGRCSGAQQQGRSDDEPTRDRDRHLELRDLLFASYRGVLVSPATACPRRSSNLLPET